MLCIFNQLIAHSLYIRIGGHKLRAQEGRPSILSTLSFLLVYYLVFGFKSRMLKDGNCFEAQNLRIHQTLFSGEPRTYQIQNNVMSYLVTLLGQVIDR